MIEKVTKIPDEDLAMIANAKRKAILVIAQAEKAAAEAKAAELEYRTAIQHTFLKNGLSINCSIDENTGDVKWPEDFTAGGVE